jgi:hypothetical protein
MAIIDWPETLSGSVSAMRMSPRSPRRAATSPYDQSVQTVGLPGGKWRAMLEFDTRSPSQAPELQALIADLEANGNRLKLYPIERPIPNGTVRGEPKVDGAGQTGRTIAIKDCQPGSDFRVGDYLWFGNQLFMVTHRCVAGPDGRMQLKVNFPVLTATINNAPIQWDRPAPLWILDPESEVGWRRSQWWTTVDSINLIQVRA